LAAAAPPAVPAAAAAPPSAALESSCIEVTGSDPSEVDALVSAADALLAHLRSNWAGLGPDKAFWQELGRIQFVPASLGLPCRWCSVALRLPCCIKSILVMTVVPTDRVLED
jgi:hypothetical protein